jgi:hypothetical protein
LENPISELEDIKMRSFTTNGGLEQRTNRSRGKPKLATPEGNHEGES